MARRRADDGWTDDHGKLLTELALKRAESYPPTPPPRPAPAGDVELRARTWREKVPPAKPVIARAARRNPRPS